MYTHVNKVLTDIVNMPDNSELTFKQFTQISNFTFASRGQAY